MIATPVASTSRIFYPIMLLDATTNTARWSDLAIRIRSWARELGFQRAGISDVDLAEDEARLREWLRRGYHGELDYMARHGTRRTRPAELVPGTLRVVSVRMDYLPADTADAEMVLGDGHAAYISRYALGRDYHKLLRTRLKRLAHRIEEEVAPLGYRVFTDSAPVMEKALARNARLGWIGKNTLLLDRHAGSYFFLGEIYIDIPLPVEAEEPVRDLCGTCVRCIEACPTGAIRGPYKLDARRCISYLTIELRGAIPEPLRPLIGNRVFGCDDCQLVCPWNRYARLSAEPDFRVRHDLDQASLIELFGWSEEEFLARTEGMALRRAGYEGWLRNVAVALGNAPPGVEVVRALEARQDHPSALVREHVAWALAQQKQYGGGLGFTGEEKQSANKRKRKSNSRNGG